MCGIAGHVGTPSAEVQQWLARTLDALHHRGPDSRRLVEVGPGCSLGVTRLRIVDLTELADQPVVNEDGTVSVVFNGEIYNHRALRERLERAGHQFTTRSDTEVIVHLYEERGVEGFSELSGMFALALWDDREQQLCLARDRLGIKPLYLRRDGGGLRFASEAAQLADAATPLRTAAIDELLTLGWVRGPQTMWEGIEELPPGSVLVRRGEVEDVFRYWSVDELDGPPSNLAQLRDALLGAMSSHLDADTEVGLFLSAGVDSTTLARAAVALGHRPTAITVAHTGAASEHVEAEAFARSIGLPHHAAWLRDDELLEQVDRFLDVLDQPTVDGLNTFAVAGALADSGLRVGISGLGGDELLGGYSTFRHVPRLVRGGRIVRHAPRRARALLAGTVDRVPGSRWTRAPRVLDLMDEATTVARAWTAVRSLRSEQQRERIRPRSSEEAATIDGGDVRTLELTSYMRDQLLRDTDVFSMAHSIEVRVPLLADQVVDVACRLPLDLSRTRTKRNVLTAMFPSQIGRHARKQTFTLPIDDWLRGPLRGRLDESAADLLDAGLGFDATGMRSNLEAWENHHADWRQVWMLFVLGTWISRRPRPSVA